MEIASEMPIDPPFAKLCAYTVSRRTVVRQIVNVASTTAKDSN
jgi:hypothetical protein